MSAAGLDFAAGRAVFVRCSGKGSDISLDAACVVAPPGVEDDSGATAVALRAALDVLRAGRGGVRLGVAGKDAIVRYMQLPAMPLWRLRLLMDVEVRDVEEKAGEPLSGDWRVLEVPESLAAPGSEGEQALVVALAKEGPLGERIAALRGAGIGVASVVPRSIALFNAYVALGHVAEERTAVLLDAGAQDVELAVIRDGALVFARTLPRPPEAARGGAPSQREAQQLAGAVASSLQLARAQRKLRTLTADEVLVSGPHAGSGELRAALRQAFKLEPGLFNPLERLSVDRLPAEVRQAITGPEIAVAVGLALSGAHPRTIPLDVLPRAEKARREFASRTVFLYAGGAALAAALIFAGGKALVERGAALDRKAELGKLVAGLEARRDALEARREANKRAIRTIDALGRRTQAGAALIRLLERLRVATPGGVTIGEVALEVPLPGGLGARPAAASAGAGAGAGSEIPFRLRGTVDDATGESARLLAAFEAGLREDPAVISARVTGTPAPQPGATVEFAIAVRMRAAPQGEP